VLAATLSHFPELDTKLETLGSGRNTDLTEGWVDAFWTQVRAASDSVVSHVFPLVPRSPPDGDGSSSGGSLRH
jgi:hypothetical protein